MHRSTDALKATAHRRTQVCLGWRKARGCEPRRWRWSGLYSPCSLSTTGRRGSGKGWEIQGPGSLASVLFLQLAMWPAACELKRSPFPGLGGLAVGTALDLFYNILYTPLGKSVHSEEVGPPGASASLGTSTHKTLKLLCLWTYTLDIPRLVTSVVSGHAWWTCWPLCSACTLWFEFMFLFRKVFPLLVPACPI